jgi:hypothetical protein
MSDRQRGEKRGLFPSLFLTCRQRARRLPNVTWVVVGLALVALALVGYPLLLGRVYNGGDITRLYLPQRVELARALRQGRLPWWTPRMGLGYPLLAGGEMGALYPPNWLIYGLLPAETGLTVSITLHYFWAALGMAYLSRTWGRSWTAALLAGVTLAFGGFVGAHLSHISMLTVASWTPWLLAATHRVFARERVGRAAGALAGGVALQFLGGHPQMSLLSLLPVSAYAVWCAIPARPPAWRRLLAWAGALLVGVLLALPQLLPSAQLALASQRAGGLEASFFTSYSFHPLLAGTLLSPFALGAPNPEGSVELMAYLGMLPLLLAGMVVAQRGGRELSAQSRRASERWFYVALAAAGLLLALGRWNPLYAYLRHVPVVNFFRVPARYLFWTSLGLASLAGMGVDCLPTGARGAARGGRWLGGAAGLLALGGVAVPLLAAGLEGAVAVWRWLPLVWAAAALLTVLAAGRLSRRCWALLALLVLVCDLGAYGVVLGRSYHTTAAAEQVRATPLVVPALASEGLERIYVKEEVLPALSVIQGSLYPNVAATYGLTSANLYSPLTPQAYLDWASALDGAALSRVGMTHYLIPQLLPVDQERELYDVYNPLAALPYGEWLEMGPLAVSTVAVESFLSHAADLPDGALAAEIVLRDASGQEVRLPIRAGLESAEWAYEREDVAAVIQHQMPTVARTWPARSGYLPWEHVGHSYLGEFPLDMRLAAVRIEPLLPEAFVRIEEITLLPADGEPVSLRAATGRALHSIVYRSEDVLVYRNEDAWPRAYAVPWWQVRVDGRDVALGGVARDDLLPVEIISYDDLDVRLRLACANDCLVVLSDLDYPGWRATVDGQIAPILRVDGVVRGVRTSAGEHDVAFTYHPWPWR